MYSVVLMAALTTGVDLPDLGHRGGGCCGCSGGCYGSCYGGCYGGCGGHSRRSHGCRGGCYGGCYGGCTGMSYGGCMGSGMSYGGCMGSGMSYGGCYGGCYGGGMMPGAIQQGTGAEKLKTPPKTKGGETMVPVNSATLVVELPADAKLFIENEATTSTGSSRVFVSPELKPGKAYQYTLKAEIVRDGKTIKAEQVVDVKAGEIKPVKLSLSAVSVAQR
jgi:uncharacterized protein (TIGR03000 family)